MFSPPLLFLTLLSPMYMLSHSFPVHIQILSPNPKHHLPFQPIFSPCVLRAYVLYVVMCLCAFVSHVTICLCNSFLCTVLPTSMNITCLYVCQYIRTIYSQCVSWKQTCNTSVFFLSVYFPPIVSLPMFFMSSSLWCRKSWNIVTTKEKNILKFPWTCF